MLTKTLAWGAIALAVSCVAWWWLDPVGFSQNPLLTWLRQLSLDLPEPHK